jgi:hypothetical protein
VVDGFSGSSQLSLLRLLNELVNVMLFRPLLLLAVTGIFAIPSFAAPDGAVAKRAAGDVPAKRSFPDLNERREAAGLPVLKARYARPDGGALLTRWNDDGTSSHDLSSSLTHSITGWEKKDWWWKDGKWSPHHDWKGQSGWWDGKDKWHDKGDWKCDDGWWDHDWNWHGKDEWQCKDGWWDHKTWDWHGKDEWKGKDGWWDWDGNWKGHDDWKGDGWWGKDGGWKKD